MEFFEKAKVVRLRSNHDKYLLAEEDEESVCQDRDGTVKNARWRVEYVGNTNNIRLISCYGKYLTASNMPFRLGLRGKKVIQTIPKRLDSSLEWEPVREGTQVRLRTPYGQFLRANGGMPPWRNSITHDVPQRSATQEWILWDIDVVEIRIQSPERVRSPEGVRSPESVRSPTAVLRPPPPPPPGVILPPEPSSPSKIELRSSPRLEPISESFDIEMSSPARSGGRTIYYHVGNEQDARGEVFSLMFKGSDVEGLKQKLKEETGLEKFDVCSPNPLNGQLYPLRLHLPPNNHDMHVVVVPLSSKGW